MAQQPKVVVALDFDNQQALFDLVDKLDPSQCRLKVGKELFTLFGPEMVRTLTGKGFEVFLDLKFHDIPNTVAKAVAAAAELGVWMVNVHASGGEKMMQAAADALKPYGDKAPLLIAVTMLTSMDQSELPLINVNVDSESYVSSLALLAKQAGLDGVVCSAQEAQTLKRKLGKEFLLVTPGIRPEGSDRGDQTRVMTPKAAIAAGSDYLVIGRPITQSNDPLAQLTAINASLT